MKKLSNTEVELKTSVDYIKKRVLSFVYSALGLGLNYGLQRRIKDFPWSSLAEIVNGF